MVAVTGAPPDMPIGAHSMSRSAGAPRTTIVRTATIERHDVPPPVRRSPDRMATAQSTATASERAHKAAKRYIYAWGDGTAEGNGGMKDLLGGKGAGLA